MIEPIGGDAFHRDHIYDKQWKKVCLCECNALKIECDVDQNREGDMYKRIITTKGIIGLHCNHAHAVPFIYQHTLTLLIEHSLAETDAAIAIHDTSGRTVVRRFDRYCCHHCLFLSTVFCCCFCCCRFWCCRHFYSALVTVSQSNCNQWVQFNGWVDMLPWIRHYQIWPNI